MAGLQKSLDVEPTVANAGISPDQGEGVAGAIKGVTDSIESFVAGKKKDELTNELKALGDDVFAATSGKAMDNATARFKRLKNGYEQGVLSDTHVKIETEKVLKEQIDKMPGFGKELRKHAADILGFDPTGAQIRALYNVPQKTKSPQEKALANDAFIAETLGLNVQDVTKIRAKSELNKMRADLVTQQATIGAYGMADILNSTLEEADSYVSTMMQDSLMAVKEGGITSPEQMVGTVQGAMASHKQALRTRYREAGLNRSAADLAKDMAIIEDQWQPLLEIAKSGSMQEILQSQATNLANAMSIEKWNVYGDLALLNSAGGQEAIKHFFTNINKFAHPDQIALMKKNNPALAHTLDNVGNVKRLSAEAYKKIMGIEPQFATPTEIPSPEEAAAVNSIADHMFYNTVKVATMSDKEKGARLNFAKEHGQKFKALGAYFQKGARAASSEDEKRFVQQTFEAEYPALMSRVVADMVSKKGTKDEYDLFVRNGELKFNYKRGYYGYNPGQYGTAPPQRPDSSILDGDLKRLSSLHKGVQHGWAEDFGVNAETFLEDTLSEMNNSTNIKFDNQEAVLSALEAYENNPSEETWEALRKADPQFAADVERYRVGSEPEGEQPSE